MRHARILASILAISVAMAIGYFTTTPDVRAQITSYIWPMSSGEMAQIVCNADLLEASAHTQHTIDVHCIAYTPTPSPTPTDTPTVTPTPLPTDTPAPTDTPTVTPTPMPTATATPIPHTEPFAAAPECATHDATKFHTLWNYQEGCHYTHSHGADPHALDDIFGTDYYAAANGDISYPWETFAGIGRGDNYPPKPANPDLWENVFKHEGYGWRTARNLACRSGEPTCIKAYRIVTHILPSKIDAMVPMHSFGAELQVCAAPAYTQCGTVRLGGWLDFGVLYIDALNHFPLPTDPNPMPAVPQKRGHRWNGGLFAHPANTTATWYGVNGLLSMSVLYEVISALEPAPSFEMGGPTEHYFCPAYGPAGGDPADCPQGRGRINGSMWMQHRVSINIRDDLDGKMDGMVNTSRFTDRYGKFVNGCTQPGLDCVPFVVKNVKAGIVRAVDDTGRIEMDAEAIEVGKYWMRYPHHH